MKTNWLFYIILYVFRVMNFGFNKKEYPSSEDGRADVAMINPFNKTIVRLPRNAKLSETLEKHENKHIEQMARLGRVKFVWLILWYLFAYGYENSPLEVEAREAEND